MSNFNKVRAVFPKDQHSHRIIRGRSEDWVEAHYLIDRLNDVYGLNWSWICEAEGWFPEKEHNGKAVYRYWCRCSLRIYSGEIGESSFREGVGSDSSDDMANAMKGAQSYALRHACKHFGIGLECWITPEEQYVPSSPKKQSLAEKLGKGSDPGPEKEIREKLLEQAILSLYTAFAEHDDDEMFRHCMSLLDEPTESEVATQLRAQKLKEFALLQDNRAGLNKVYTTNIDRWHKIMNKPEKDKLKATIQELGNYLPLKDMSGLKDED